MFSDDYTESLFAQAVKDNCQKNLEEDLDSNEPIEYSHEHIIKMEKLIQGDEKRELRVKIFAWTRRIAATAAAFFIVVGGVLLTVPEVRAAVIGAIQNRTEHYTDFSGEPTDADGEFKHRTLGYIPEGFTLASEVREKEYYSAAYVNDKNQYIKFQYALINGNISVNNEDAEYSQLHDDGTIYHVFESYDKTLSSTVLWDNGEQLFCIFGVINTDELLKIAKNVT
jgi:hypothetical protein